MSLLGLDFGERRIGVALAEAGGTTARPLTIIVRESRNRDLARLRQIVEGFGVEVVVVGLPLNMDGTSGQAVRRARRFANQVQHQLGLRVELWDERLTTWEADQQMLEAGLTPERRRELRDAVAAALILQDYLQSREGQVE
jgi:putative Holliday junction resolvase